jgi:glycosyltransferase involved in cell wall biosynthesis
VLNAGFGLDRAPARKLRTAEALRRADVVLAVSQNLGAKVIELGADPSQVHVCPQGVDTGLFSPGNQAEARGRLGIPTEGWVVLWVGGMVPVKGLDVLLAACSELVGRGTDFHLYLVGDGPLRRALEAESRSRGLSGRIHFVGRRPNDQLPDWYRAADLTVLPSWSEGLPNVLRESLACGTPFVASRVGGIPEIAGADAGRLVDPGDPVALAEAIGRALRESPAGQYHQILSWEQSSQMLAGIFRSLSTGGAVARPPAGGPSGAETRTETHPFQENAHLGPE